MWTNGCLAVAPDAEPPCVRVEPDVGREARELVVAADVAVLDEVRAQEALLRVGLDAAGLGEVQHLVRLARVRPAAATRSRAAVPLERVSRPWRRAARVGVRRRCAVLHDGEEADRVAVQLNHTIVYVQDSASSARWLAEVLGLRQPTRFGPFWIVETDNGVSLDYLDADEPIASQHYAFLVTEEEFDIVFGRVQARGLPYWADPGKTQPGRINRNDGGRGVYFDDPDGHRLEILTRPYGSGA